MNDTDVYSVKVFAWLFTHEVSSANQNFTALPRREKKIQKLSHSKVWTANHSFPAAWEVLICIGAHSQGEEFVDESSWYQYSCVQFAF